MAKVKFPTAKPSGPDGLAKRAVDGDPAAGFTNTGGPKGAKVIGRPGNASAGKLKTYKTSVASLNTGEVNARGGPSNITDRNDL